MAESPLLPLLMVNSPLPHTQGHLQLDKQSIFLTVTIVLSFVLLVATFVLYAHWLCRYRHTHYPPTSSHGVDPAVLGSLPIVMVTAAADRGGALGSECAICLGLFLEGEEVKMLPGCTHAYHSECVDKWLATRSSCPLCRFPLDQLSLNSSSSLPNPGQNAAFLAS